MLPDELDLKAVMAGTGLSRRTLGRYLADGTLAGYKAGTSWRITRTALEEAIEAGRISWRKSNEQASTTDDVDWRTRALVAEAKLEAVQETVTRMDATLTAMMATLQLVNAERERLEPNTPASTSTALEVQETAPRRRWWRR